MSDAADLTKPYPNLFAGDVDWTCGAGWYPLLRRLFDQLEPMAAEARVSFPDRPLHVVQVKQKLGGLRVYVLGGAAEPVREKLLALIREAEEEAERTCELCGQPGSMRELRGYYTPRCDAHAWRGAQAKTSKRHLRSIDAGAG
jgi:hypothetical protein